MSKAHSWQSQETSTMSLCCNSTIKTIAHSPFWTQHGSPATTVKASGQRRLTKFCRASLSQYTGCAPWFPLKTLMESQIILQGQLLCEEEGPEPSLFLRSLQPFNACSAMLWMFYYSAVASSCTMLFCAGALGWRGAVDNRINKLKQGALSWGYNLITWQDFEHAG